MKAKGWQLGTRTRSLSLGGAGVVLSAPQVDRRLESDILGQIEDLLDRAIAGAPTKGKRNLLRQAQRSVREARSL